MLGFVCSTQPTITEIYHDFASGNIVAGIAQTGMTALSVIPAGRLGLAVEAVSAQALERFGMWGSRTAELEPSSIRFTQETISYLKQRSGQTPYTLDEIISSMKNEGWKGSRIDVVKMPEGGYTTLDHTRVVAAKEAGINVKVNIRAYNERLPEEMIGRFKHPNIKGVYAQTWGEAAEFRIIRQSEQFIDANFPLGTYENPRIVYPKNNF